MTDAQRKKVMCLLHAVVRWQAPFHNGGVDDHDELCDLLHGAVDDMDNDTINELTRIVNGGVNLRSVPKE
jgi:hypothetical protein